MEEFLRIYGHISNDVINNIFSIFSSPVEMLKIIENIDGKIVPLIDRLSTKERILLVINESEKKCLTPKDIIKSIPGAKVKTIYSSIRELEKLELVVDIGNGRRKCLAITKKGINFVYGKLGELTRVG